MPNVVYGSAVYCSKTYQPDDREDKAWVSEFVPAGFDSGKYPFPVVVVSDTDPKLEVGKRYRLDVSITKLGEGAE